MNVYGCVSLPYGAVGWSVVCDCAIFLVILTYFSFSLGGCTGLTESVSQFCIADPEKIQ